MFLTEKMIAALNVQVGQEFANALQYIAIANWFESEDLTPDPITIPERQKAGKYQRPPISEQHWIPRVYPIK